MICFILLTCVFPAAQKPCYVNVEHIKTIHEWEMVTISGKETLIPGEIKKVTNITVNDVKETPDVVIQKIKECK